MRLVLAVDETTAAGIVIALVQFAGKFIEIRSANRATETNSTVASAARNTR